MNNLKRVAGILAIATIAGGVAVGCSTDADVVSANRRSSSQTSTARNYHR